jgi:hypothetical protein
MTTIAGRSDEANEERLFTLLKAVTEGRAIGFETDAATDFTPWGLHRPFLKLRFLGQDNQGIELAFGIDGKGAYFVNRIGTPTVMRVDPSLVASIAVRPYEWRQGRLWSLDRTDLMQIDRTTPPDPTLSLRYNDATGDWTATQADRDVTQSLDPTRANFMLGILEGLKVTRWLADDDEFANKALDRPSLAFKVYQKARDEEDNVTGIVARDLIVAPATPGANPGFYYGRLGADSHPFLLDRDTYEKIALNVFDQE